MRDVGGWNGRNAHPYQSVSQWHGNQDTSLTRQQADEGFSRGELEVQSEWKCSSIIHFMTVNDIFNKIQKRDLLLILPVFIKFWPESSEGFQ